MYEEFVNKNNSEYNFVAKLVSSAVIENLESILRSSVSAGNFSDKFLS
jgi:hypothetical protein